MADDGPVIYDRQTLYDEVWAEPMLVVAKRYGVSSVALAKTCRRLGIPVPGRGYWARLRAGITDPRAPLPALEAGQSDRIVVPRRQPASAPSRPRQLPGIENAVPIEVTQPIVVFDVLASPHKLVQISSRALAKAHTTGGILSVSRQTCLDIQVAPASLDRALRIFDALIKAVEGTGLRVEVAIAEVTQPVAVAEYQQRGQTPIRPRRVTRIVCDEESIEFELHEEVRRVEVPVTTKPSKDTSAWRPREYDNEPSGELALQLMNASGLGIRTKWQDGKQQRLEDLLAAFVSHLSTVALAFKLQRQEAEREAIAAREEEHRRLEASIRRWEEEEHREKEKRREEALEAEVGRWRRAGDIRNYVAAVLRQLEQLGPDRSSEELVRERMRWALEYADKIDPVRLPSSNEVAPQPEDDQ